MKISKEQINEFCDGLREMLLKEHENKNSIDINVNVNITYKDEPMILNEIWRDYKIKKKNYEIKIEVIN